MVALPVVALLVLMPLALRGTGLYNAMVGGVYDDGEMVSELTAHSPQHAR